ncbi:MAG: FHA domain-containing protein, partial [Bacteriovoracaceae bacterium]|nr:FHA domain-containing protein [Bacteriovoracaceae bacterium]
MVCYELDVRSSSATPKRIKVENRAIVGKAANCAVNLTGEGIAPQHLLIRENNEVLTVTNLTQLPCQLNGQNLIKGKTYILDKSDEITIGDWSIIVRRTQVEDEASSAAPEQSGVTQEMAIDL